MKLGRGDWVRDALFRCVHDFFGERVERNALMTGIEVSLITRITDDVIAFLAEATRACALAILDDDRLTVRARITGFLEETMSGFRRQSLRNDELFG